MSEHLERPGHLRLSALLQVTVGGMLGAATRDLIEQALPTPSGSFPLATFVINLGGAFLLGMLLEALVRGGDDKGWRRSTRLTAGTGFLGAFTTYSTFAVEADLLAQRGHTGIAELYAVATVAGGLVMVTAGIAFAAGGHHLRQPRLPIDPDLEDERVRRR